MFFPGLSLAKDSGSAACTRAVAFSRTLGSNEVDVSKNFAMRIASSCHDSNVVSTISGSDEVASTPSTVFALAACFHRYVYAFDPFVRSSSVMNGVAGDEYI